MTDPLGPSDPQFWLLVAGVATVFTLVRLAPALLLGRGHRISPGVLHTRLTEGTQLLLLDVRGKHEYDDGHIAGARWVPSSQLTPLLRDRGSWLYRHPDRPIVTICHSGVLL